MAYNSIETHNNQKIRQAFQDLCSLFPDLTLSLTNCEDPKLHIQDEFGQEFSIEFNIKESTQLIQEIIFSIKEKLKRFDA